MKENIIVEKSEKFAIRIIRLYKLLCERERNYDLFRQFLRSGTSIGANVAEAVRAMSKKDFLSKLYISYKECGETSYWLQLLKETDYLSPAEYDSIASDCRELEKIISSIIITTKNENITIPNS